MRFAVAATILANTLPATLRPNGVLVEAREEKRQLWRALLHAPASDRPQAAKQAIAARRRKLGNGGMLKNLASPRVPPSAECNPDVGVLACGFGEYCNGSMESSLGGVCVPLASEFRRGLDQGMYGSAAPTDSPLDSYINVNATGSPTASPTGTNGTYTDTTGGPGVYCDPDSPFYGDLECNCEDWVSENNTGALECTLFNETCYTGCEDTCYSIDFSYNTDGSAISYQYCYDFVSPFEQTFCFGFSSDQSCLISLDGTTCSSCYTSYRLNCDNGSCDSESCSNFNCSNLDLGTGNSCYDSVVPPAFYDCYLYLNDQYPSCSICPDDNIAYPETYFDLPGYGSFNCSYIGDLASYGTLNPQQCTYATALAANACCEGAEGPVYICNICTEEDHIVTNVDALVNIPGQPAVTCGGFEALAVQGRIDEAQCGIVQGFVAETCGCMHPDDISPTMSPVAGPPTPTMPAPTPTSGTTAPTPSGVTVILSAIASLVLGFVMNYE